MLALSTIKSQIEVSVVNKTTEEQFLPTEVAEGGGGCRTSSSNHLYFDHIFANPWDHRACT